MKKKIYLQAGFWSIIVVINLALVQGGRHPGRDALFELISIVFYALAFYVNIFWLFPRYYDRTQGRLFCRQFPAAGGYFSAYPCPGQGDLWWRRQGAPPECCLTKNEGRHPVVPPVASTKDLPAQGMDKQKNTRQQQETACKIACLGTIVISGKQPEDIHIKASA